MSKQPIWKSILSVGNLKPKFKGFFKPKPKPNFFPLNCHPAHRGRTLRILRRGGGEDGDRQVEEGQVEVPRGGVENIGGEVLLNFRIGQH